MTYSNCKKSDSAICTTILEQQFSVLRVQLSIIVFVHLIHNLFLICQILAGTVQKAYRERNDIGKLGKECLQMEIRTGVQTGKLHQSSSCCCVFYTVLIFKPTKAATIAWEFPLLVCIRFHSVMCIICLKKKSHIQKTVMVESIGTINHGSMGKHTEHYSSVCSC